MPLYEIETLIENKWRREKESWEQARVISYITAQSQSTKKIDPKKILPFPWDNVKLEQEVDTKEERESVMREMKEWETKMNKENK